MKHTFKAKIYKTGINWAVDVPFRITKKLVAIKGYIKIKGTVNGYAFKKSLVPVKDAPYRLFVNAYMMKGGSTALGKIATFAIEQDTSIIEEKYPIPAMLRTELKKNKLTPQFNELAPSRKKDILRYLQMISKDETMKKNVKKVIDQLKQKKATVRIP